MKGEIRERRREIRKGKGGEGRKEMRWEGKLTRSSQAGGSNAVEHMEGVEREMGELPLEYLVKRQKKRHTVLAGQGRVGQGRVGIASTRD